MDKDTILGILIIVFGLSLLFYVTLRSRQIIKKIALKKSKTTRDLLKDFQNGK